MTGLDYLSQQHSKNVPKENLMKVYSVASFDEFQRHCELSATAYSEHIQSLEDVLPADDRPFTLRGYSCSAEKEVDFYCDFNWGSGFPNMNWRERVVCPITHLNNRMRAALHVFELFSNVYDSDSIYIMEQTTPMYSFLRNRYPNLIGSEYLGDVVPLGALDDRGLRNEDATRLTFSDNSLSTILSFDVLEHIYDYKSALKECLRALKPGGSFFFTAPFNPYSVENIERAVFDEQGQLKHLLAPEYHGNPLSSEGVLCFRHYGWSLLRELRQIGFAEAKALVFFSSAMGYCTRQLIFHCRKAS
ncbi:class I SAM-dependent methyltransferase [Massilia sp. TS11]|uniref:class I SAM-dependent methyltransferase n=1 Tax=Massilia sp. TS11 TaxID=2908003 RepID=UPI001EDBC6F1|nr:class I SAM-dependent methyltransferase [Massilia sp. TS11]MCG2582835.1 class I SAM-dependent methyltransferase [Massilia sp. TS11]